ncbi:MAG: glycosyltransferase family 4 protein [Gammaproteobacteria bacterium]|nr:glycosyltransferase family 4 protein [Gammaproteobacteria bacterium]
MRVTILHRYFWPQEYPYAQMLKDITESVNNLGYDVRIMTTTDGSANEKSLREKWQKQNNIKINVLKLGAEKGHGIFHKLLNSLYYGAWVFTSLCFRRNDIVMVATTPPIITAALVRWASYIRRFKYIYHCQDIHPEAMLLNSNIRQNLLYNILLKIDSKNINQAWKVITLSEDMKNTFKKRSCRTEHVKIINNFPFKKVDVKLKNAADFKIRFLFAGSLGRFQNLEMLMRALIHFGDRDDVEFVFLGEGVLRKHMERIKNKYQLVNVQILGQKSVQEAVTAMGKADFGIVSISPRICEVAYPSKAIMYIGNGLPIFALVDDGSELSRFVIENKIGFAVSPSSEQKIVDGIEKIIENHKLSPISRQYTEEIASIHFGKNTTLEKIAQVFTA